MIIMRYKLAVFLILFATLTVCHVSAADMPRLPDFHVTERMPGEMVAGSTFQTSFTFVKPNHKPAELNITVEITEKQSIVGFEEFHVEGTLDTWTANPRGHETVEMGFTETGGGVFQSERFMKEVSFNYVALRISLAPNLMPGTYTFTITVKLVFAGRTNL